MADLVELDFLRQGKASRQTTGKLGIFFIKLFLRFVVCAFFLLGREYFLEMDCRCNII